MPKPESVQEDALEEAILRNALLPPSQQSTQRAALKPGEPLYVTMGVPRQAEPKAEPKVEPTKGFVAPNLPGKK